ncbi:copper chaperone PCu(A)C [Aestuariirhabdus sp. Z084]|uniref:copper chaperone PCu(A)C n=1 Tax=Aestuariirhabdus haliotis TaxID=2918751 RepID=UPI00201B4225|nr:copper chaperone PCu(A)C [Aestuariirhabdus haliotis]MCL6415183.1 copper chaperone PCu(A)C [Aestuariirhabdus haliotis]MCL6420058.1 copper chaperone PCu(A)C [Aestuariirhabdus haliotis]
MRLSTLVMALLCSFSVNLYAGDLMISDGWVRAVPPEAPNSAAYMKIANHKDAAVTLVAANSSVAKMVQIHLSKKEGGMMKMEHQKEGVAVPAGGTLELKPGSYHVMLMGLKQPLKEGDQVKVVLKFSDGSEKELMLPVATSDMKSGMSHMDH